MLHLQLSHTLSLATQTFGNKVLEKKLRKSTCGLFRGRGGEGVEEREGEREGGGEGGGDGGGGEGGREGEREGVGGREGEREGGGRGRGREEREREGGEGGGKGVRVYQVTFANLSNFHTDTIFVNPLTPISD